MRQRYGVSIALTTDKTIPTTTITAALALALESEAIKEVGDVRVVSIAVDEEED
jgi:hypothetical protein